MRLSDARRLARRLQAERAHAELPTLLVRAVGIGAAMAVADQAGELYCRVCGDSGEPFHRPGLTPWAEPDLCAICAVYHEGAG